ncbi:MAG TPA: hypothetical protein PLW83_07060 [Deltaproteobacteria bacterium]|nr:hypothetical protein [Deltaproteobacteria bacterium]
MTKRLVVVKNRGAAAPEGLARALSACGWECETIELAKGEPLPRSLQEVDGLLILGDSIDVYDQGVSPMQVYLGS